MEAKMDLTMFKEIPGYKAILKAVLKSQIQMLVEQLSEAEEESVVLTASLTDGTLSHLGSMAGKNFLDERQEIKSQFLFHCLKKKTNIQSPSQDHVFHGSRSSTTLIDQEPGFIPGRTSTTVPNQEPVFIPEMGPLDVSPQQEERLAKRPRRTLPEIPFSFGRGRAVNTGITFEQGLQDMHSGPFGQGLALARGSRGRGTAVGRGFVAGRGIPSARGAASGRGRRHGKFSTRGRGRGVRRISSAATATITSPDQNIESDEVKYEFNDVSIENTGKAEPDLVTIKAENFEVSIDLNSPVEKSTKPVSLRKNSSVDMSPSVKLKRLSNKAVKTASTPMKAPSDSDNENMDNQSIGNKHDDDSGNDDDDKEGNEYGTENDASSLNTDNSVSMDDSLNVNKSLNVSHVNIKQEAPDDDELLGMETCATQQYGVSLPGPSGEMGKQSLANTETDANGAQSSNKVDKQTPRKQFNIRYHPLRNVLGVRSSSTKPKGKYKTSGRAKTRAEIQRAYRDRKKAAMGQEYFEIEKQRVRDYNKRIKQLKLSGKIDKDVLEERRRRSRESMRAYRIRKKAQQLNETIQMSELEKQVKSEVVSAIKSELEAQSGEDESFLNEETGMFDNMKNRFESV